MKKSIRSVFLAFVFLAVLLSGCGTPDGKIVGRVFVVESGKEIPIANAIVTLQDFGTKDEGIVQTSTTADAQGKYTFENVLPGKYYEITIVQWELSNRQPDFSCPFGKGDWTTATKQQDDGSILKTAFGGDGVMMEIAAGDVVEKDLGLECP